MRSKIRKSWLRWLIPANGLDDEDSKRHHVVVLPDLLLPASGALWE